jgi:hypothetical protein
VARNALINKVIAASEGAKEIPEKLVAQRAAKPCKDLQTNVLLISPFGRPESVKYRQKSASTAA